MQVSWSAKLPKTAALEICVVRRDSRKAGIKQITLQLAESRWKLTANDVISHRKGIANDVIPHSKGIANDVIWHRKGIANDVMSHRKGIANDVIPHSKGIANDVMSHRKGIANGVISHHKRVDVIWHRKGFVRIKCVVDWLILTSASNRRNYTRRSAMPGKLYLINLARKHCLINLARKHCLINLAWSTLLYKPCS